jgi:hypothetical protein
MAGWRRAVDLAMTAEEIETLTALARSRTEAARHVERAQVLDSRTKCNRAMRTGFARLCQAP